MRLLCPVLQEILAPIVISPISVYYKLQSNTVSGRRKERFWVCSFLEKRDFDNKNRDKKNLHRCCSSILSSYWLWFCEDDKVKIKQLDNQAKINSFQSNCSILSVVLVVYSFNEDNGSVDVLVRKLTSIILSSFSRSLHFNLLGTRHCSL